MVKRGFADRDLTSRGFQEAKQACEDKQSILAPA
jgi:hypothetical protein